MRNRTVIPPVLAVLLLAPGIEAAEAVVEPGFATCLTALKRGARGAGISGELVEQALGKVVPRQRVIELDRRQPEVVATFAGYLNRRVTEAKVERARALASEHRGLLDRVAATYGVPGQYLLALWGIETNFGRHVGDTPLLEALATLACDPRRGDRFNRQLLAALRIVDDGLIPLERMSGSWAGAMGYFQFMPAVYLRHAVDFDGDGHKDLWALPDALASAASFLRGLGWQAGIPWGREVQLPERFPHQLAGETEPRPLAAWRRLGVRQVDGGSLPAVKLDAALILPAGHRGPAFLVHRNFNVFMRWNNATFFSLAVGHLADRIDGGGPLSRPPPEDQPGLTRETVQTLQERLNQRGFHAGHPDGVPGAATRKAIRAFQRRNRMIPDGHAGAEILEALGLAPAHDSARADGVRAPRSTPPPRPSGSP